MPTFSPKGTVASPFEPAISKQIIRVPTSVSVAATVLVTASTTEGIAADERGATLRSDEA
jgi:hypothetical protein